MRQIKFRAWDESQKYMAKQGTPDLETIQSFFFHFGNFPLMQFTGLTDKNGIEIYEGDIIQFLIDNEKYIVEFTEGSFCIVSNQNSCIISMYDFQNSEFLILGNIYENTELLQV